VIVDGIGQRDLWWAEGAGLITGTMVATGLGELRQDLLWRGASLLVLAAAVRLASFAAWRRLRWSAASPAAGAAGARGSSVSAAPHSPPELPEPAIAGEQGETPARPPVPPPVSPPAIAAPPPPDEAAGAASPTPAEVPGDEGGGWRDEYPEAPPPARTPAGGREAASSLGPLREQLAEVWLACLRDGEGQFAAPALRRALLAAGLGGQVLDDAPAGNLFAVDPRRGAGDRRVLLLPLPGVTARAVAEWFSCPASGGSRLARIQRVVRPAVARRGAAGWELLEKGVVE
jgi:hypothetical protein